MERVWKIFLLGVIFCITSSCEDNDEWKGIIAERIGTELVLSEGLVCYNNIKDGGEIGGELQRGRAKIIVYINGECMACVDQFSQWEKKWDDFTELGKVSILIYVRTQDVEELKRYIKDIGFSHPFFIDPKSDLLFNNKIPYDKPLLHTFLLDQYNKIVLVGSPIGNMRLENLYKQEILRLIE